MLFKEILLDIKKDLKDSKKNSSLNIFIKTRLDDSFKVYAKRVDQVIKFLRQDSTDSIIHIKSKLDKKSKFKKGE